MPTPTRVTPATRGEIPPEVEWIVEVPVVVGDPEPEFYFGHTSQAWLNNSDVGDDIGEHTIGYRFARRATPDEIEDAIMAAEENVTRRELAKDAAIRELRAVLEAFTACAIAGGRAWDEIRLYDVLHSAWELERKLKDDAVLAATETPQ